MSEIILNYVEQEPLQLVSGLEVGSAERAQVADALMTTRAQWVVNAISSELTLRGVQALDEIDSLEQRLQAAREGFIDIEIAPGDRAPKNEAVTEKDKIMEKFRFLNSLANDGILRETADQAPFDIVMTDDPYNSTHTWIDQHPAVASLFGPQEKTNINRTLNSLHAEDMTLSELKDNGVVSNIVFGSKVNGRIFSKRDNIYVGSFRVEKPTEFFNYAVKYVTQFGVKSIVALITLSELQELEQVED